jgi:iron complex transport system substrate-binding protein
MIENSTDARAALAQRRHGDKIARAIARLAGTNGVFLTYCTKAVLANKDVPALENVQIPLELNLDAEYGMIVLQDAPAAAGLLAKLILAEGRDPERARARAAIRRVRERHRARFWRLIFLAATAGDEHAASSTRGTKGRGSDRIEKVFAAGPPASILLYMLAPDKMTGWPNPLTPEERPYIAPQYRDLPALGRLTGRGGTANLEVVLKVKPDLILDFGSVRDTYASLADNVQEQTKIPYVLIDGRFDATPAALRLLGDILGLGERGEQLAKYVDATFADIDKALDEVPPDKRPRVYLARGPDGLETGVVGSINTEIIERAGGRNVAEADAQRGLVRASMEQVIVADPEIILTWDRNFFDRVSKDPLWAGIRAVREGRVYLAPTAPFGWIDRPPSLNRVIGLAAGRPVLSDKFMADLRETTRRSIVRSITWTSASPSWTRS